jgi:hypothetical protein
MPTEPFLISDLRTDATIETNALALASRWLKPLPRGQWFQVAITYGEGVAEIHRFPKNAE